jgi:hypothetical protein
VAFAQAENGLSERLMVRRKRRKHLVRDRSAEPRLTGPNQECAMDFIVDGLATGSMRTRAGAWRWRPTPASARAA